MGYRSDVKILITTHDIKPETLIKKLGKEAKEEFENCFEIISDTEIHFHADDVKWYSDFKEVQQIEDWLHEITELDGVAYHFIRIGEDIADIEENIENDPDDYIELERYTSFKD